MKATGIVRKVDELGRTVLPIELRRSLESEVKDPVEIFVEDERIILKKYSASTSCVFCGEASNVLLQYQNRTICRECVY